MIIRLANVAYSIRIAQPEDAARIAILGAHVWVHTYLAADEFATFAQYVEATFTPERILTFVNDPSVVLLIAETATELAGYIVIRFGSDHADVSTEIETLYVHNLFGGRGIGSALLNHARDIAMTKTGHRAVWLTVNSRNEKAISFYRSHGMTQEGVAYFELDGVAHENKVMVAR
jgi:diamine N-acetyltransferase